MAQSKANRQLAESRLELAALTLRRSQQLNSRGAETRQVLDEYTAEFKVAEATLRTAAADIEAKAASANRLAELQKFQKVLRRFAGSLPNEISTREHWSSGSSQALIGSHRRQPEGLCQRAPGELDRDQDRPARRGPGP